MGRACNGSASASSGAAGSRGSGPWQTLMQSGSSKQQQQEISDRSWQRLHLLGGRGSAQWGERGLGPSGEL